MYVLFTSWMLIVWKNESQLRPRIQKWLALKHFHLRWDEKNQPFRNYDLFQASSGTHPPLLQLPCGQTSNL